MPEVEEKKLEIQEIASKIEELKHELSKYIVGQKDVIDQVLLAMFAGGHILLEGLPGLGKTMLVRKLSEVMVLKESRIQFTPDLMPSDITGTYMIQPDESGGQTFVFHDGPLFANFVLADEINRATPKTQSALLEAMQEHTVTIMGDVKKLPSPFFVLATQNPIEHEGTYPLPEAQMDRFICKIHVTYPSRDELKEIVRKTTGGALDKLTPIVDGSFIKQVQREVREILVADSVLEFAIDLIAASHPTDEKAPQSVKDFIRYGSGPRGLQSLILTSKARALFHGRYNVSVEDIRQVAKAVLRHRLFLNFEGEASEITTDMIINDLLASIDEKEKIS